MSGFILSIPAQIKKLTDRLAQAANLDNLNATISSRAPASTALSNTVWTPARANNLNAPLSGVATQSSANAINTNVNAINANVDASLSTVLSSIVGPRKIQVGTVTQFPGVDIVNSTESVRYAEISISPVSRVLDCIVLVRGGEVSRYDGPSPFNAPPRMTPVLAFLKNTSTLRIEMFVYDQRDSTGFIFLPATWIVVELQ